MLFSSLGPDERIDGSQAKLVEIVHTSGGFLGFKERLGHRDFYPNGGDWPQPGCKIDYSCKNRDKLNIIVQIEFTNYNIKCIIIIDYTCYWFE